MVENFLNEAAAVIQERGIPGNHRAVAEQMGVRSQTQYKQEYLATLFTSDTLYGTALLRKGDLSSVPTSMFPIAVPA